MLCLSGFELYSRWVPLSTCVRNTQYVKKRVTGEFYFKIKWLAYETVRLPFAIKVRANSLRPPLVSIRTASSLGQTETKN